MRTLPFVNRVSLSFEVQGDLYYWGSYPVQMCNAEAANLGLDKDLDIQVQLGSKTRGRTREFQVPELRGRRQWRRMWGVAAPCTPGCWLVELEVALFKRPCYLGEH